MFDYQITKGEVMIMQLVSDRYKQKKKGTKNKYNLFFEILN